MKKHPQKLVLTGIALLMCTSVMAKLPALSDEAKAKAAEAAAKTAWSGKVDGYLLCKAQDKTVAHYNKTAKADAKDAKLAKGAKAPAAASTCVDPGPFVYTPAAPSAVAPVAAPAPAAAASAATATPAKKS